MKKQGKHKAFHLGSNSSCQQHIHGHYSLYKEQCAEQNLEVHHYAVPWEILRKRVKLEKGGREGQHTLNVVFIKPKPKEFSREGVLKAVAEFVVCDDQVSSMSTT